MDLWTPYADKPLDLRKDKRPIHHIAPQIQQSSVYEEEIQSLQKYRPVFSPPSHDVFPPGSINGIDTGFITEDPEYQQFEREALESMAQHNGGSLVSNNPKMRREIHSMQMADEQYRQQRQKNNMAAKRSRDRRKMRELSLALQVAYLSKKLQELQKRLAERYCRGEEPDRRYGTLRRG